MKKSRYFALLVVLALATGGKNAFASDGGETRIVSPFALVSLYARHHVMAWFDGHDEYESVEAFDYGDGKIRAILTKRDNTQIDVFNYAGFEPPVDTSGRTWYSGTVSFALAQNGRDAELNVEMPDGKNLTLAFFAQSPPDPQYGFRERKPIILYDITSRGAVSYLELARELMGRGANG